MYQLLPLFDALKLNDNKKTLTLLKILKFHGIIKRVV